MSGLIKTWQTLASGNGDYTAFNFYAPNRYDYGNRTNDWGKAPRDDGELQRGGFTLPYSLRGASDSRLTAIDLPGGPGTPLSAQWKSTFAPARYRVAAGNWRGAGNSLPLGQLNNNTTEQLVEDIEALRLAVVRNNDERIMLRGNSWGMAMAVAYAAAYPDKIAGITLGVPFLARPEDVDFSYSAKGALAQRYPHEYEQLTKATGKTDARELMQYLSDEMGTDDPRRAAKAFVAFTKWEYATNGAVYNRRPEELDFTEPMQQQMLARARIFSNYTANDFFLNNGIRDQLNTLGRSNIPVILLAHAQDPLSPPGTLDLVKKALPKAEIHECDIAWHSLLIPPTERSPSMDFEKRFAANGYAYGMGKLALIAAGDTELRAGVFNHKKPAL